jgi:hypothetical protein
MPFDGTGYEVDNNELHMIDEVIALLSTKRKWCKRVLETWDGRRCILGAMMAAHAERALKAPVLGAIREVTGSSYLRIEQFNDDPATTHALVLQVLHHARRNIEANTLRREVAFGSPW